MWLLPGGMQLGGCWFLTGTFFLVHALVCLRSPDSQQQPRWSLPGPTALISCSLFCDW